MKAHTRKPDVFPNWDEPDPSSNNMTNPVFVMLTFYEQALSERFINIGSLINVNISLITTQVW